MGRKIHKKDLLVGVNIILCLLASTSPSFAQESPIPLESWEEAGLPYIQNFGPKEYRAGAQNWYITQDKRGVMYFGNEQGMLIFDGASWKLIKTPKQTAVRSITMFQDRIYIGGQGDLGYYEADVAGRLHFTSLMDSIPEENRNFKGIWQTFAVGDDIYFRTYQYVFRWSAGQMDVWKPKVFFHTAMVINNKFYVREWRSGLKQMVGDSLELAPGGEFFAEHRIYEMLPYDDSNILCLTREQGLFLYDDSAFKPLRGTADNLLRESDPFHAAALQGGLIAIATQKGGIAIVDRDGNLCQLIDKSTGLRDENVSYAYVDSEGGLWAAFVNGLARIEIPSPLSSFSDVHGLEEVQSIIRHQGKLYASNRQGVSYLASNDSLSSGVQTIKGMLTEGLSTLSSSLLNIGEQLLAGSTEGLYQITNEKVVQITHQVSGLISLHQSIDNPKRIYGGSYSGLAAWELENSNWKYLGRFDGVDERIISIAEDEDGVLWLGTTHEGVLKVDASALSIVGADSIKAEVARFGKDNGLPEKRVSPARVRGRILFATQKGLKRFEPKQKMFVPDSTLGAQFAGLGCSIFQIQEEAGGDVWVIASQGEKPLNGVVKRQADASFVWKVIPFLGLKEIGDLICIYPEKNGVVWFGGSEGMTRYTPVISKDYTPDYQALIRQVSSITLDSVYFQGAAFAEPLKPILQPENNSLRFEFAAPTYDDLSSNRYQTKLEGFDKGWSNWTAETKKDYTGLGDGDYTFRVRAKNIYEHQSSVDVFSFSVLPPWYQSWWAYLIYILSAATGIFGIVKIRVMHLERKTQELEAVVAERTATIREQAEKLEEVDQMKSRFFANISHEFRTPLTLIMGPLEDMIAKAKRKSAKEELNLIHRNADRVLRLINQLLDLSRLESGGMQLNVARGDLLTFLKGIVMSFASLAEQKKIILQFDVGTSCDMPIQTYFDHDKIEKIFYNLLSNAFKFTPVGGKVSVRMQLKLEKTQNPKLETVVSDSGIGIPADRLPNIFDRFYQATEGSAGSVYDTSTREQEGTGIGLALTKELVELHYGEIEVHSEEGKGTEFVVRLPVGKEHLKDDEIANESVEIDDLEDVGAKHLTSQKFERNEVLPQNVSPLQTTTDDATIILVVDDHPEIRSYIRNHLQPDYQIIEAKNGSAGVDAAIESIPDLVISDVMMPKMDGYQLCQALKTNEKTSHIPVILLTAKAGEQDKLEGLETGADDYLTKPFNSKELHVRVHNLIEQRRKLRERFVREGMLQPREVTVTSVDDGFLQKLMSEIEEHLSDEDFGVETLSGSLHMGRKQLYRKIRAMTDLAPTDFIRSVRLQRAKQMLEKNAGSVSEIAFEVGFNNLSYFSKCFREQFGRLPSEYVGEN